MGDTPVYRQHSAGDKPLPHRWNRLSHRPASSCRVSVSPSLQKLRCALSVPAGQVRLDYRARNRPTGGRLQHMKAHALSELGRRTEEPPISWLMATALAQPEIISLAAGFTDNESLPVKEVRGLLDEILCSSSTGQAALQYGTTPGDPKLRELTAR